MELVFAQPDSLLILPDNVLHAKLDVQFVPLTLHALNVLLH
jgi:hypothetical protein